MRNKILIFLIFLSIIAGIIGFYIVYNVSTKNMIIHATISVDKNEYMLGENVTFYLNANTYWYAFDIAGEYPMGDVGIGIFLIPKWMNINDIPEKMNRSFILKLESYEHGVVPFHWTNKDGKLKLYWNGTVLNRTEGRYYIAQSGYYLIYPITYAEKNGHHVQFLFSRKSIFYFNSFSINISKSGSQQSFIIKISSPFNTNGSIFEKFFFDDGTYKYLNKSVKFLSESPYLEKWRFSKSVERIIITIKIEYGELRGYWKK